MSTRKPARGRLQQLSAQWLESGGGEDASRQVAGTRAVVPPDNGVGFGAKRG